MPGGDYHADGDEDHGDRGDEGWGGDGDEDHHECGDGDDQFLMHNLLQTMYAGKYMNMYGLPGAGGTEQVIS